MLDPKAIQEALEFNRASPTRQISFTMPLPDLYEPFHVGAFVVPKHSDDRRIYVIVGIIDEFALLVIVSSGPVCAYMTPIHLLRPVNVEVEVVGTPAGWDKIEGDA